MSAKKKRITTDQHKDRNEQRRARTLARERGITYQEALQEMRRADAGTVKTVKSPVQHAPHEDAQPGITAKNALAIDLSQKLVKLGAIYPPSALSFEQKWAAELGSPEDLWRAVPVQIMDELDELLANAPDEAYTAMRALADERGITYQEAYAELRQHTTQEDSRPVLTAKDALYAKLNEKLVRLDAANPQARIAFVTKWVNDLGGFGNLIYGPKEMMEELDELLAGSPVEAYSAARDLAEKRGTTYQEAHGELQQAWREAAEGGSLSAEVATADDASATNPSTDKLRIITYQEALQEPEVLQPWGTVEAEPQHTETIAFPKDVSFFNVVEKKVDLEDYLTTHLNVKLVHGKPGTMQATCPFHDHEGDGSPSSLLIIQQAKTSFPPGRELPWKVWNCCTDSGTVLDAVMRAEGVRDRFEAAKFLNKLYGLGLDRSSESYQLYEKAWEAQNAAEAESANVDAVIAMATESFKLRRARIIEKLDDLQRVYPKAISEFERKWRPALAPMKAGNMGQVGDSSLTGMIEELDNLSRGITFDRAMAGEQGITYRERDTDVPAKGVGGGNRSLDVIAAEVRESIDAKRGLIIKKLAHLKEVNPDASHRFEEKWAVALSAIATGDIERGAGRHFNRMIGQLDALTAGETFDDNAVAYYKVPDSQVEAIVKKLHDVGERDSLDAARFTEKWAKALSVIKGHHYYRNLDPVEPEQMIKELDELLGASPEEGHVATSSLEDERRIAWEESLKEMLHTDVPTEAVEGPPAVSLEELAADAHKSIVVKHRLILKKLAHLKEVDPEASRDFEARQGHALSAIETGDIEPFSIDRPDQMISELDFLTDGRTSGGSKESYEVPASQVEAIVEKLHDLGEKDRRTAAYFARKWARSLLVIEGDDYYGDLDPDEPKLMIEELDKLLGASPQELLYYAPTDDDLAALIDATSEEGMQAPSDGVRQLNDHRSAGATGSTGAQLLDLALKSGGVPRGRIVDVFGPPPTASDIAKQLTGREAMEDEVVAIEAPAVPHNVFVKDAIVDKYIRLLKVNPEAAHSFIEKWSESISAIETEGIFWHHEPLIADDPERMITEIDYLLIDAHEEMLRKMGMAAYLEEVLPGISETHVGVVKFIGQRLTLLKQSHPGVARRFEQETILQIATRSANVSPTDACLATLQRLLDCVYEVEGPPTENTPSEVKELDVSQANLAELFASDENMKVFARLYLKASTIAQKEALAEDYGISMTACYSTGVHAVRCFFGPDAEDDSGLDNSPEVPLADGTLTVRDIVEEVAAVRGGSYGATYVAKRTGLPLDDVQRDLVELVDAGFLETFYELVAPDTGRTIARYSATDPLPLGTCFRGEEYGENSYEYESFIAEKKDFLVTFQSSPKLISTIPERATTPAEKSAEVDSAKQNLIETMEDLGADPEVIDAVRGPVAVSKMPRPFRAIGEWLDGDRNLL